MMMRPGLRKLMLTAHITSSVGWIGAVAVSLILGAVAMTAQTTETLRAAYLMLDLTCRWALVPLSVASLLTGLVQALGTRWGLLRHYWVLFKFLMNVLASAILLLYAQTLAGLARMATQTDVDLAALRSPSPVLHAAAALVLLLVAVVLSVYKPAGLTGRGHRLQQARRDAAGGLSRSDPAPSTT